MSGRDFVDTPGDDRYDDAYYSRLFEREGPRVRLRLVRAAERLGSLWLSAFEDAGRPALDPAFRVPYVRGRRKLMRGEPRRSGRTPHRGRGGPRPHAHLARLRERGADRPRLRHLAGPPRPLPATPPSSRAPGPDRHGITGNSVYLPGASLLLPVSGYRSEALRAEPLWVTAARQGQRRHHALLHPGLSRSSPTRRAGASGATSAEQLDLRHRLQGTLARGRGVPGERPPRQALVRDVESGSRRVPGDRARGGGHAGLRPGLRRPRRSGSRASTPSCSPSIRMRPRPRASSPCPSAVPKPSSRSP